MASSGYYSPLNSSPSKKSLVVSSEFSNRHEESMGVVIGGAWPMSQPIQYPVLSSPSYLSTLGSVELRKSLSKGLNGQKIPRPLSMPSQHYHVHANALVTLNSYSLQTNETVQVPLDQFPQNPIMPTRTNLGLDPIPTPPPSCAPWISNVKAIKKLQSKIGIGSFSWEEKVSGQILSPLRFNSVHGDNIQIFQAGTAVRRLPSLTHGYCKAIVFSDRPVKVNERVCVKVIGTSTEFVGGIRFGFTNQNPSTLRYSLPDHAIPELAKRQGFWVKALLKHNLVKDDAILFFYVNQSGKVRYGINGKKAGTFLKYVDMRKPLWVVLDVYGNTTAIELVDPKAHLNNSRKSLEEWSGNIDEVDSALGPSMNSLNLNQISPVKTIHNPEVFSYKNLQIHPTCGKNIQLNKFRNVAWRNVNECGNGYIFTSRPLQSGETIVIQVQQTEETYNGSMAFGFTSTDPEGINPKSLPDDSYYLVDRPEYWIFKKDVVSNLVSGDELAFTLTPTGTVLISKNAGPSSILMYVDNSGPLWGFLDLYGSTYKIALIGSIPPINYRTHHGVEFPQTIEARTLRNSSMSRIPVSHSNFSSSPSRTTLKPTPPTGLTNPEHPLQDERCNPSTSPNRSIISRNQSQIQAEINLRQQVSEGNLYVHLSQKNIKHIEQKTGKSITSYSPNSKSKQISEPCGGENKIWSVHCVACCERAVNSVFSPCGHFTMCYECSCKYWNSRQKTCCPICGAEITDVIRIVKS